MAMVYDLGVIVFIFLLFDVASVASDPLLAALV